MAERDLHKMLLGEILVSNGNITAKQLETALEAFKRSDKLLGEVLLRLGFISEKQLLQALCQQLNVPMIELVDYPVDLSRLRLVSEDWATKFNVLILGEDRNHLLVAMSDPLDYDTQDTLRLLCDSEIRVVCTPHDVLGKAIQNSYCELREADRLNNQDSSSERPKGDTPAGNLLNSILKQALVSKATDIHIEPCEKNARVRFRVDGILKEVLQLELDICRNVIERIKEIADLDTASMQLPQFGRINIVVNRQNLDSRISILPAYAGEKVAIRILNQERPMLQLDELGFSQKEEQQFRGMIANVNGFILVTGPDGSGRTTTLYAALSALNTQEKNINTIESPVKYLVNGVTQVQVDESQGLDLKEALHCIKRQDPDIIMLGDIGNKENAGMALQSAANGHLVLGTLHRKDTVSAISQLLDMGITPYLLAEALKGIVAQRLVKKVCPHCKKSYLADEAKSALLEVEPDTVLYHGTGCIRCAHTGYLGRTAVFEMLPIDDQIRETILSGAPERELLESARRSGLVRLAENCKHLVLNGTTSAEEYDRFIYDLD